MLLERLVRRTRTHLPGGPLRCGAIRGAVADQRVEPEAAGERPVQALRRVRWGQCRRCWVASAATFTTLLCESRGGRTLRPAATCAQRDDAGAEERQRRRLRHGLRNSDGEGVPVLVHWIGPGDRGECAAELHDAVALGPADGAPAQ